MKKIVASISFLCYLMVTSGVIVNFHYCMNRLASMQWFVVESKTCPKCGMHIEKSDGCCRDEVKIVKMEVDQKMTAGFVCVLPAVDDIGQSPSEFIVASFYNVNNTRHFHNHSPPLLTEQDTYLRNGVFRI